VGTLDHVRKEFGNGEVVAVDDVNLTIGDVEFMVLVGPSGCGKTGIRSPSIANAGRDSHGHAVVGIRPEAFEDAAFAPSNLPQIDVRVEVLEELGSDVFLFFEVDAEPVVVEDAVSDEGRDDDGTLIAGERDRALFAARVDARTKARVGQNVRLSVDPSRLYFFSPATGESLLGSHNGS